jgi:CBS domain-containing protein
MKVGNYCKREVVTIAPTADVAEACKLMRDRHVGFVIVVEQETARRVPVGVITDRDVVVQVNARDVDQHKITVRDVMTRDPLVAQESDEFSDLLQSMRSRGVRRVPVTDTAGSLTGVIANDDALDAITAMMCELTGSIHQEQRSERKIRQAG